MVWQYDLSNWLTFTKPIQLTDSRLQIRTAAKVNNTVLYLRLYSVIFGKRYIKGRLSLLNVFPCQSSLIKTKGATKSAGKVKRILVRTQHINQNQQLEKWLGLFKIMGDNKFFPHFHKMRGRAKLRKLKAMPKELLGNLFCWIVL